MIPKLTNPIIYFGTIMCLFLSLTPLSTEVLPSAAAFNDSLSRAAGEGTSADENTAPFVLVVDAGHGGKDPGGMGANSREKHIALAIAEYFVAGVRRAHPEVSVVMTRADDTFIPLYERAAIANRLSADLFVSIHANIMPGSSATYGTETFVMGQHVAEHNLRVAKRENASILLEENFEKNYDYDPNSDEGHILMNMFQHAFLERSIQFAELVERQFATYGRKSRGVKQAGFVVLKETTMPSVLVETGFMSNPKEEAYLLSDAGRRELAAALVDAFTTFYTGIAPPPVRTPVAMAAVSPISEPEVRNLVARGVNPGGLDRAPVRAMPVTYSAPDTSGRPGGYVFQRAGTKEERVRPKPATVDFSQVPDHRLVYGVQLLATKNKRNLYEAPWTRIPYPILELTEGGFLKYEIRGVYTAEDAQTAKRKAQDAGFSDAMITVRYQGKRVPPAQVAYLLNR